MILDDWKSAAPGLPVNPFYERVTPFLKPLGDVLDAGAGLGTGALMLRNHGFSVTALEPDPKFAEVLREKNFPVIEGGFELAPPEQFDGVLCVFSLFFAEPNTFDLSWQAISKAVRPDGIWAGQFLGERDEWVGREPVIAFTRPEIADLLDKFAILEWEEVERDGKTAWGATKRWHIHHVIARRI